MDGNIPFARSVLKFRAVLSLNFDQMKEPTTLLPVVQVGIRQPRHIARPELTKLLHPSACEQCKQREPIGSFSTTLCGALALGEDGTAKDRIEGRKIEWLPL